MKRARKHRLEMDVQAVIAVADKVTQDLFAMSVEDGYVCTGGRAYRRKDGTWTARIVMRKREAVVSTITLTTTGLVFP